MPVVILGLLLVVAAVAILRPSIGSPAPAVTGTLSGTVATVNADGTAICINTGDNQDNLCYGLWLTRGQRVPEVSDKVSGWVVRVPLGASQVEQFILSSASPGG